MPLKEKKLLWPFVDYSTININSHKSLTHAYFTIGRCSTTISSAFSWIGNGKTYFFKGKHTWRFNDERSEIEKRYPISIPTEWTGIPNDIDEAFLWGQNYVSYFFKVISCIHFTNRVSNI